jgi:hypothetical protein
LFLVEFLATVILRALAARELMVVRWRQFGILLLLGLLWVSVHVNFSIGRDLRRVCKLIGPQHAEVGSPRMPHHEIGSICLRREPEDWMWHVPPR